MLLSLTLENWMSFRDPVTFSMVASRERQHGQRVPRVAGYGMGVLPVAALYGGNASGKSNFVEAFRFAQKMVTGVTQPDTPIPVQPFRLGPSQEEKPSRFCFVILVDKDWSPTIPVPMAPMSGSN